MKIFYSFLFLIFCSLAVAQESSYYDSLTEEEAIELDCSNVLDFMEIYFSLNTQNQKLMLISANRLSSIVAKEIPEDTENQNKIIEDLDQLSILVEENTLILEDTADSIMEILPTCLQATE